MIQNHVILQLVFVIAKMELKVEDVRNANQIDMHFHFV